MDDLFHAQQHHMNLGEEKAEWALFQVTAWNKVCLGLVVTSSLLFCYLSLILADEEVPGEGGCAVEFL